MGELMSTEAYNDPLCERDRKKVAEFVERHAGIQLPASKRSLIESRLRKRQRQLQFPTLEEYIAFALDSGNPDEPLHLIDCITTNKTDFYREPDHFTFLDQWLKQHLSRGLHWRTANPLKIWSAGCATGEEPYTLAIQMLELQRLYPALTFRITATDISKQCLQTASNAIYDHNRIEPISQELRQRYLLRSRDSRRNLVKMAPEVTCCVQFKHFNLLGDAYPSNTYDIIFCRNVMIYFKNQDCQYISSQFHRALKPEGLLFIGHSEALADERGNFRKLKPTIYQTQGRADRHE